MDLTRRGFVFGAASFAGAVASGGLNGFAPLAVRRIRIKVGASAPFKALHVSDSHLTFVDSSEKDERKVKLAAARASRMGYGARYLAEAATTAERERAVLVHTGDMMDFVSNANLVYAEKTFGAGDWIVCAGNHEYSRYVGEAKEDSAYKSLSFDRVARHYPNDLTFFSRIIHDVNFVSLDDIYYNFTERQLALMQREVAKGLPIVMMCHVPMYVPKHYEAQLRRTNGACAYQTGVPTELVETWRKERDYSFQESWRDRRVQQRPDAATLEFVKYMRAQPLLKAVLCGHCHGFWQEPFSKTADQIVAPAIFNGEAIIYEVS